MSEHLNGRTHDAAERVVTRAGRLIGAVSAAAALVIVFVFAGPSDLLAKSSALIGTVAFAGTLVALRPRLFVLVFASGLFLLPLLGPRSVECFAVCVTLVYRMRFRHDLRDAHTKGRSAVETALFLLFSFMVLISLRPLYWQFQPRTIVDVYQRASLAYLLKFLWATRHLCCPSLGVIADGLLLFWVFPALRHGARHSSLPLSSAILLAPAGAMLWYSAQHLLPDSGALLAFSPLAPQGPDALIGYRGAVWMAVVLIPIFVRFERASGSAVVAVPAGLYAISTFVRGVDVLGLGSIFVDRQATINHLGVVITDSLQLSLQAPFVGVGLSFATVLAAADHTVFLPILVQGGLLGTTFLAGSCALIFTAVRHELRWDRSWGRAILGVGAIVVLLAPVLEFGEVRLLMLLLLAGLPEGTTVARRFRPAVALGYAASAFALPGILLYEASLPAARGIHGIEVTDDGLAVWTASQAEIPFCVSALASHSEFTIRTLDPTTVDHPVAVELKLEVPGEPPQSTVVLLASTSWQSWSPRVTARAGLATLSIHVYRVWSPSLLGYNDDVRMLGVMVGVSPGACGFDRGCDTCPNA